MAEREPGTSDRIRVEVAYGEPARQRILSVELKPGARVEEAIEASGIQELFPQLEVHPDRVGVWSRKVSLREILRDGDRVEIYRPLQIDPKEARRARANAQNG